MEACDLPPYRLSEGQKSDASLHSAVHKEAIRERQPFNLSDLPSTSRHRPHRLQPTGDTQSIHPAREPKARRKPTSHPAPSAARQSFPLTFLLPPLPNALTSTEIVLKLPLVISDIAGSEYLGEPPSFSISPSTVAPQRHLPWRKMFRVLRILGQKTRHSLPD